MPEPTPAPRSVHLVGAPGPIRDAVLRALGSDGVLVHDEVAGVPAGGEGRGGPPTHDEPPALALLLADSVPVSDALDLLRRLASDEAPWIVGLVEPGGDGPRVRTLSLGWPRALGDVAGYVRGEGEPLLELRDVVRRVSRARHDINNPLTSALAQTQLLLLDHGGGEMGEELRDLETQIKRIAALVAGTAAIRPRDG